MYSHTDMPSVGGVTALPVVGYIIKPTIVLPALAIVAPMVPHTVCHFRKWHASGLKGARVRVVAAVGIGLAYEVFCQVGWVATLIGCCMAIRDCVGQRTVMRFARLMPMVFLYIFEARMRYVFLHAHHLVLFVVPGRMRMWDVVAARVSRCNR